MLIAAVWANVIILSWAKNILHCIPMPSDYPGHLCFCCTFTRKLRWSIKFELKIWLFVNHFLNRHGAGVGGQVSVAWGPICCSPLSPSVTHNISTAALHTAWWQLVTHMTKWGSTYMRLLNFGRFSFSKSRCQLICRSAYTREYMVCLCKKLKNL